MDTNRILAPGFKTGHKRDKQDIPLLARNGVKVLIAVGMGQLSDIWDMRLYLKMD